MLSITAVVMLFQNCSGFTAINSLSGSNNSASIPPPKCQNHATLTWTAPTTNTNGTPLTDLAGYIIGYGNSSKNYTTTVPIYNPTLTTYVINNLAPGVYYFAMKAVNSSGVQSVYSNEAILNLGYCGASGTIHFGGHQQKIALAHGVPR